MEQKIALTFYQVQVHERGKPRKPEIINQLTKKHPDLMSVMENFFTKLPKYQSTKLSLDKKSEQEKIFLEGNLKKQSRKISGILRHGHNGYSSAFFDMSSGNNVFNRKANHVELMPFYFSADFELGRKSAILCFQTFGVYSVGGAVNEVLCKYLNDLYGPEYIAKINIIQVGGANIQRYIKSGKIKDIYATQYSKPKDKVMDKGEQIKSTVIFSPRARGARFSYSLNKLLQKYADQNLKSDRALFASVGNLVSKDVSDYSELEFGIDLGAGIYKKVDFDDIAKSSTRFIITDQITRQSDGHPTYASVDKVADSYVEKTVKKVVN